MGQAILGLWSFILLVPLPGKWTPLPTVSTHSIQFSSRVPRDGTGRCEDSAWSQYVVDDSGREVGSLPAESQRSYLLGKSAGLRQQWQAQSWGWDSGLRLLLGCQKLLMLWEVGFLNLGVHQNYLGAHYKIPGIQPEWLKLKTLTKPIVGEDVEERGSSQTVLVGI